jgi:hypothetical protein
MIFVIFLPILAKLEAFLWMLSLAYSSFRAFFVKQSPRTWDFFVASVASRNGRIIVLQLMDFCDHKSSSEIAPIFASAFLASFGSRILFIRRSELFAVAGPIAAIINPSSSLTYFVSGSINAEKCVQW